MMMDSTKLGRLVGTAFCASILFACEPALAHFGVQEGETSAAPTNRVPDLPRTITSEVQTLSFELTDNLVRIDVDVNGQRRSGVLDSGTSSIIVDRKVSRDLGLNESDSAGEAAGGGSEARPLFPVTLAQIAAGPWRFENVTGYSVDLGHLSSSAQFPVDILLGSPAFQGGAVTVDYPQRRISVGPSGSAGQCAAPIPLEIVHDVPVVDVDIVPASGEQPVRLKLVVDLGTRHHALLLGGPFVRDGPGRKLAESAASKKVGQGVGGEVQGVVVKIADVRAGSMNFGQLEASLTSGVPAFENGTIDGTLGVPLWIEGAITFDFPARLLCIARR